MSAELVNTLPQSVVPNKVTLSDCLELLKKDILLTLNCHAVATIQEFDSDAQTATATVNYKKTYFQLNASTGQYDPVLVDYPELVSCPVIFLGGGPGALTFPVAVGDECLVLFNDRDMDTWFQGNPTAAVATPRLHSFSDGIILVGLRSSQNVLDSFDATRVMLRGLLDGSFYLALNPENGKMQLMNSSQNLADVLQDILTHVKSVATHAQAVATACAAITVLPGSFSNGGGPVGGVSGVPVNASSFTTQASNLGTDASNLGTDATNLGELLE